MMNTYAIHPRIHEDPLPWLLEEDFQNPGIRFLALRDLLGMQIDNPELAKAQRNGMSQGPSPSSFKYNILMVIGLNPGRVISQNIAVLSGSSSFLHSLEQTVRIPRLCGVVIMC